MTTTTVLSDDTATIVQEDSSHFNWGAVVAGAVIATALTFFLISVGSGLGLSLVSAHGATSTGIKTFLTGGAIYFLAAQAFGFAIGGHVTGRLMGTTVDEAEEETFRTDAHGLAVWALAVVFGVAVIALTAGPAISAGGTSQAVATPVSYFADKLFRTTSAPQTSLADAKAEAGRLLTVETAIGQSSSDSDRQRLVSLVSQYTGLNPSGASDRVNAVEGEMRAKAKAAADAARRAASYVSIWTALALLFSAVVCVVATLSARWDVVKADYKR